MQGTPKSLEEAIINALGDPQIVIPGLELSALQHETFRILLKAHVKDFIAQKFNVAMFKPGADAESLRSLYSAIVGEK